MLGLDEQLAVHVCLGRTWSRWLNVHLDVLDGSGWSRAEVEGDDVGAQLCARLIHIFQFLDVRDGLLELDGQRGVVRARFGPAAEGRSGVVGEGGGTRRAGERSAAVLYVVAARLLLSISLDEVDALVVGPVVGRIVGPEVLLVVDVPGQHAVSGDVGIPPGELTVLEDVVFALARIVEALGDGHDESLVAGAELQQRVGLLFRQHHGSEPAQFVALVGAHAGGDEAVVVVAALVEQVVAAGSACGRRTVGGVVEVGQAEDVGELMAEGAYAVHVVAIQFVRAGIVRQEQIVVAVQVARGRSDVPGMGPDVVLLACVVFALAGIEGKDEVDEVVVVGVIDREIHVEAVVQVVACLRDHLPGIGVVVLAVVFEAVLQQDGAEDVELRVKLSARVLYEEVVGRTDVLVFAALIAWAVVALLCHHVDVGLMRVVDGESHVLELHQHDEAAHLASGREAEVRGEGAVAHQ